jgi:glutamate 5-kinase
LHKKAPATGLFYAYFSYVQYGDLFYMETLETTQKFEDLLVVKVGTNTLADRESIDWLALDQVIFNYLAMQMNALITEDTKLLLVTSAAIVAGYMYSHEERTVEARQDTVEKQRMACLGQVGLMCAWQKAFAPRLVGQLLVTSNELDHAEGAELRQVIMRLLERGDIPAVNEDDAVSHKEITFGDNDMLAAQLAVSLHNSSFFERTRLILLSDIDGVYEDITDKNSVISVIDDIDSYEHLAGASGSANGTGGMASKFQAAKIATENGVEMYIANGRTAWAIERALDGEIGTRFTVSD